MIVLGSRVRDRISGFTGIASSRHEYLNGCVRWAISPERTDKDGKLKEDKVFDEGQLELAKSQAGSFKTFIPPPTRRTGGPERHDDRDRP